MKFFLFLLFVSYGSKCFFISTEMCSSLSLLVMKYLVLVTASVHEPNWEWEVLMHVHLMVSRSLD